MIVAGLELTRMTSIAFLPQRFAGLRARIIKFAGLTNDDRTGTNNENFRNIVAAWHDSFSSLEKHVAEMDFR